MKLLHKGKVKEVYAFGEDKLLFNFTDQISVFDKIIPTLVPKKGEALCRTSAYWFEEVARLGLDTHFLGLQDQDKMLVKRLAIIPDSSKITPKTVSFFIPLEVVCRHYLAGSMHDRVKSGETSPEQLGFPKGHVPKYGEKLPKPLIEFTTKLEPTDRLLSEAEALKLSGLTEKEFHDLKDAVLRIDERISRNAEARGLIHVDGKKEFGMNHERKLMVVDTFGTPDEDRWWDKRLYESEGKTVELSKEMVRQHYRDIGYHEKLYAARKAGQQEPPIPALPDDVTRKVTALYVDLYERLTGRAW
ncbi:MAG: phosphoribosylaminoimidazole-succinocarboxamide synthase [Thermoplasmata archaeon]|jgi:phosphoribosylaminoimidazole-succinocarboxamide synthase|nr:phosphoribosylaminoimidazole-succinocarboxamide synthase [Thermoplasmata archaeon]